MAVVRRTSPFKKDVKRPKRRGRDSDGFKYVIENIVNGLHLELKYRDHYLAGVYKGSSE